MQIEIIKCHGSGNKFVMVDLTRGVEGFGDMAAFAREICSHAEVDGSDGVLYVVHTGEHYAMRMFNPDGSEAEMCGNGIRCVARLVEERYIKQNEFTLASGGGLYPTCRAEDIGNGIKAYGVDIAVRTTSADFGFAGNEPRFVNQTIPALDENIRFTALNLGNPHIVAAVEEIDMDNLVRMGEAVTRLKEEFPKGINVSLYKKCGNNAIYVATYERGAGITYSCGTAMTASSTASVLLGLCDESSDIEVYNRGGMVRCMCRIDDNGIVTRLTGNATYEWSGVAEWNGAELGEVKRTEAYDAEVKAYNDFVATIKQ